MNKTQKGSGTTLGNPNFLPKDLVSGEARFYCTRQTLSSLGRRARSERITRGERPANVPEAVSGPYEELHPTKGWRIMGPARRKFQVGA